VVPGIPRTLPAIYDEVAYTVHSRNSWQAVLCFAVGNEQQKDREEADHRLMHTMYVYCHKDGCLSLDGQ